MSNLEKLKKHRDAILLAEIGGWLHMLGKYDWQFIEKHCGGVTSYDYQNFVSGLNTHYPQLFNLLDPNSSVYQSIVSSLPITSPTSIGVFIQDHRKTKQARQNNLGNELTMLLVDAHGRGSNIEKSEINANFPKQTIPDVYLSTAFGFTAQLSSANYRTNNLHQELEDLVTQLSINNIDYQLIQNFRQQLIPHFNSVIAETRLPFNDVTLLDQTASTVAFFKSALAERVVAGSWKPLVKNNSNQYKWRTLTVSFAGLEYLHSVSGITDLLGRQNILTKAQDAVQTLLEITYPVGQEIYRDEQCSLFLVPDEGNLLVWQNSSQQNLDDLIQQKIINATDGDMLSDLQNSLMPQGTRTLYTIGQQINAVSSTRVISDVGSIVNVWQGVANQQICTNCGLRPQGPSNKAGDRKVCNLCLKRRDDRSKEWVTEQLEQTVWLDEVADNNGRLALLVGSWDLTEWLNGTLINTIIAASDVDFNQLKEDCRKSLQRNRKGNPQQFQGLLTNLLNKHVRQQFNNQFRGYFEAIIQPEWQHFAGIGLTEETIAAMHFVRQNPSFARLRRVWQTTRNFWQTALDEKDAQGNPILPTVDHRLEIIPVNREALDLGHYHTYDLKLTDSVKLSVVWDSDNHRFITCDNLEYLAKPELLGAPVVDFLKGKLTLEEPTGYGSKNKMWGKIIIESVHEMENSSYTPAIPILSEPRTFMALVPADKAVDIVQAIKTKYEREMGKVRNRLPLHLGAVYFQRRTPLRAALDAGRRMLDYKSTSSQNNDEVWTVTEDAQRGTLPGEKLYLAEKKPGQFAKTITVELKRNGRSFTWYVPAKMGDGATPDNWYPYVFFYSDKDGQHNPRDCSEQRACVFKGIRPKSDGTSEECWLIHASQLKKDDKIYFTPATFDFQWLDTSARRFEIAYEKGCRRNHLNRPYLLDELDEIQTAWGMVQNLSKSQLYAMRDLVEAKRADWFTDPQKSLEDSTFRDFCVDVIRNTQWPKKLLTARTEKGKKTLPQKTVEQLTNWTINGLLTDVVELYLSIMKKDLTGDKSNE